MDQETRDSFDMDLLKPLPNQKRTSQSAEAARRSSEMSTFMAASKVLNG